MRRYFIKFRIIALCISLICLSALHKNHALRAQTVDDHIDNSTVTLTGIVTGQPDDRQIKILYTLKAEHIVDGSGLTIPLAGFVLVTDRSLRTLALPGDRIDVTGKLKVPVDEEGQKFSYKNYLARYGITAILETRELRIVDSNNGQRITRMLWTVRRAFEMRIERIVPEPAASLLAGLLTGSKRGLPGDITRDFQITGLSHIIAISGSNITMILSIIGGFLFFLPLKWRFIPSIIGITLFTLLVGAEASVVRACIMGILGLIALQHGRMAQARLLLAWTAFFMLLYNPYLLWVDMGFQLSFLAVVGLIELSPLFEPLLRRVPQTFGLREALQATLCAQCTAVPWSAFHFGLLPLISPLANIIVAPLIPLAMLLGFIGTVAGIVHEPLGYVVGAPGTIILEGILTLSSMLASLPLAAVTLPAFGTAILVLYYASLTGIVLWMRRRHSPLIPIHGDAAAQSR